MLKVLVSGAFSSSVFNSLFSIRRNQQDVIESKKYSQVMTSASQWSGQTMEQQHIAALSFSIGH
jgi:hypothetical protein